CTVKSVTPKALSKAYRPARNFTQVIYNLFCMVEATLTPTTLSPEELRKIDAYWRAANYLAVGQIYLLDNPLLREPLKLEHIKPRLLGHWGTSPGLNFIYVHLNRLIKQHDLDMIFVIGPG